MPYTPYTVLLYINCVPFRSGITSMIFISNFTVRTFPSWHSFQSFLVSLVCSTVADPDPEDPKLKGDLNKNCLYFIQHSFICRPTDSTASEDARIEPGTVATFLALAVRRTYHSATSLPQLNGLSGSGCTRILSILSKT
jgi:hypothetical protein